DFHVTGVQTCALPMLTISVNYCRVPINILDDLVSFRKLVGSISDCRVPPPAGCTGTDSMIHLVQHSTDIMKIGTCPKAHPSFVIRISRWYPWIVVQPNM